MVAAVDMPSISKRGNPKSGVKNVYKAVDVDTKVHGNQNNIESNDAFPLSGTGHSSSSGSSHSSSKSVGSTEEEPATNGSGREALETDAGSTSSHQPTRPSLLDHLKSNLKIMVLGQVLSLLLASAGAAQATLHLNCGLSAPTFTMTLVYLGLAVIYLRIIIWRHHGQERLTGPTLDGEDDDSHVILSPRSENDNDVQMTRTGMAPSSLANDVMNGDGCDNHSNQQHRMDGILLQAQRSQYSFYGVFPLTNPIWWYLMIAFVDVEANAVTMLAFRYTTLTSVTVLDALAIPAAMAISRCWLGRTYRWMHYGGLVVCMVGVVMNVLQDYKSDVKGNETEEQELQYPHKFRGDLCAIIGGLLYGLSNVLTEVTVQDSGDTVEYLAMIGVCGFVISLVQSLVLEWDDILEFLGEDTAHSSTCSLGMGWMLFFTFAGVTILNYAGTSQFLMISEAAFFNLSLLTGDLWSVVFSIVAEHIVPQPLFFVALVFVLSGVVMYEMAPSPAHSGGQKEDYDGIQITEYVDDIVAPSGIPPSRLIRTGDDDDDDESDEGIEMNESVVIS